MKTEYSDKYRAVQMVQQHQISNNDENHNNNYLQKRLKTQSYDEDPSQTVGQNVQKAKMIADDSLS